MKETDFQNSEATVLHAKGKSRENFTQEILDTLEKGIQNVYNSDNWKQFLAFNSKFHKYSCNNRLLIAIQNPNATRVASMTTWNNLGRKVIKGQGALGIKILAPKTFTVEVHKIDDNGNKMYNPDGTPIIEKVKKISGFTPVSVYDVTQTEGKPIPELLSELDGMCERKDDILTALKEIVHPVPIEFEKITNGAKGFFESNDFRKRIVINERMSDEQTIKTAVHEVAHCLLHSKGSTQEFAERDIKEIQAESVAYTVCKELGIDTTDYSFTYVASWAYNRDTSVLKQNIDVICSTADHIIQQLKENLTLVAEKSKNIEEPIFKKISQKQLNTLNDANIDLSAHELKDEPGMYIVKIKASELPKMEQALQSNSLKRS